MHGVGSPKRVKTGEQRSVGRPPIHGLYSRSGLQSIQEMAAEVRALEQDLDDTDGELALMKATLWYLVEQTDKLNPLTEALDGLLDGLPSQVERLGTFSEADIRGIQGSIAQGYKSLVVIDSLTSKLLDAAMKIVNASKARADTKAQVAESRAIDHFVKLAGMVRNIVHEIVPDEDTLNVFEARMRREIYGPLRVTMPEREDNER